MAKGRLLGVRTIFGGLPRESKPNAPRDEVLRLMPQLRVRSSEISAMLQILDEVLTELE